MKQLLVDLRWLIEFDPVSKEPRHSQPRVFLMGDSAGACQAFSLLLLAAQESPGLLTAIQGVLLVSPWFELSCRAFTYISNAYGVGSHTGDICWPRPAHLHPVLSAECAEEYLGSASLATDVVFSPYWLCSEKGKELLRTLVPHQIPMMIITGSSEVLSGEALDFTQKLKEQLPIETWLHEGMFHVFTHYDSSYHFASRDAAWSNMCNFINRAMRDKSANRGIHYFINDWHSSM